MLSENGLVQRVNLIQGLFVLNSGLFNNGLLNNTQVYLQQGLT